MLSKHHLCLVIAIQVLLPCANRNCKDLEKSMLFSDLFCRGDSVKTECKKANKSCYYTEQEFTCFHCSLDQVTRHCSRPRDSLLAARATDRFYTCDGRELNHINARHAVARDPLDHYSLHKLRRLMRSFFAMFRPFVFTTPPFFVRRRPTDHGKA